jgi:hypothetical protein
MSTLYIWDNDRIVTLPRWYEDSFCDGERNRHLTHKFMVDSAQPDHEHRFGYMQREYEGALWTHIPKEMFPKEFLTHLLLLGVS